MTSLEQSQELQKAIRSGNVDQAMLMAQGLALVKAPITIKSTVNGIHFADKPMTVRYKSLLFQSVRSEL